MTTLLDLLDLIGRAAWEPFWVPLLVWTGLVFPLWGLLKRTDRLHPLAEYRFGQLLLGLLPLGLSATALLDLLHPGSAVITPAQGLSVAVLPAIEATGRSVPAGPTWHWTQAVGLLTMGAALAALTSLSRLALGAAATIRVRDSLEETTEPAVQARAGRIACRLGVNRPVRVCLSPDASVPVTLGGLRPTILLPADLADRLDALRLALVHECVHVRRYDDLAHLLERIVTGLFVAHPLVGQLQRQIAEAREQACDSAVLADDRHSSADYARLLLAFADGPRVQELDALSLSESPSSLPNRLRAMRYSMPHWFSSSISLSLAILVGGSLLLFSVVACSESVSPFSESTESVSQPRAASKVDERPSLKGGMEALTNQIQYPEMAKKAGIQGRILIQFVVGENGTPRDVQVTRGLHTVLDSAAVHALRNVEFTPGKAKGAPVPVKMTLPITFSLPSDSSPKSGGERDANSASAGLGEVIFHDLSKPQQDHVLSGPTLSRETRSALNSAISYPELIRKAGIEGTVKVTFTLSESGTPIRPRVTNPLHESLDAMALRSVRTTTFTTAETGTVDLSGTKMSVRFAYRLPDRSS